MPIKPLPQPGDRLEPITLLEGAALLLRMANNATDQCLIQKGPYVKLRRVDIAGMTQALRSAAAIIDHLTGSLERGERFDESKKLPQ
jgi:hypothetical protein